MAENEQDLADPDELPEEVRWKHHDKDIGLLLRKTADFIVYLDTKVEVHWQNTRKHEKQLLKAELDSGAVQARITCLEAIPVDHLPASMLRASRCILGEAMCAIFEENKKSAQQLLAFAEQFITARNHEHARRWYLNASAVSALIVSALTAVVAGCFYRLHPDRADGRMNILAVGLGGATGALFSILLRVGRAPLDPAAGKKVHHYEAAARIVVGVIAAAIVLCSIRSQLILPQLTNASGLVLACLIAGASERMAWAIIERVEGAVSNGPDKQKVKQNDSVRQNGDSK